MEVPRPTAGAAAATHTRPVLARPNIFYCIFALSGFSGLIYESIWSHYLKLFLGHAAYAQSLVLAIFMGGMAIGAALASRRSRNWPNLLRTYAVVEGLVGVAAIAFHSVYGGVTEAVFEQILPAAGSPAAVTAIKWSLAAMLILPQSILLGMTFPLMASGFLRRFPDSPGRAIALLYFANSFGAALGVLASGFVAIPLLGLAGTIAGAGVINLLLAAFVWQISAVEPARIRIPDSLEIPIQPLRWMAPGLLAVAAATGAASFIYEIAWIRMLSLVLGASTHSFELMLSAFILGLAIGGFWIRGRIDSMKEPLLALAWIQIAMGLLALGTLLMYALSFDFMAWLLGNLPKSDTGYAAFLGASSAIAIAVMFPAAFCAGMTLPLITARLLRAGAGEASIGQVYAANTVGAIAGTAFASHIGLPWLGVHGLLGLGAGLDICVGLLLLAAVLRTRRRATLVASFIGAAGAMIVALTWLAPKNLDMASGVFRSGELLDPEQHRVVDYADGKTATISLTVDEQQRLFIRTNGKPDASVYMGDDDRVTADELTMILSGLLPLMMRPQIETAAVIGFGSGLSTHALLASPSLHRVDTIEIESRMIELARAFEHRNRRAYDDGRSFLHVEDAKTYFSTRQSRYDLVVSEPSNPWVSGVSSLFSIEFYRRIKRHLTDDGLLIQWLQTYEIDRELVFTVLRALDAEFADWSIYASNYADILIVASPNGAVPALRPDVFDEPQIRTELERVGIHSLADIGARRLGDAQLWRPLLERNRLPANSDFHPVLDYGAARARYLGANAAEMYLSMYRFMPLAGYLQPEQAAVAHGPVTPSPLIPQIYNAFAAQWFLAEFEQRVGSMARPLDPAAQEKVTSIRKLVRQCRQVPGHGDRVFVLFDVALQVVPYLSKDENRRLWQAMADTDCLAGLQGESKRWQQLFAAVGARDATRVAHLSTTLLRDARQSTPARRRYLLAAALLSHIRLDRHAQARAIFEQHWHGEPDIRSLGRDFELIVAHMHSTTGESSPD